MPATYPRQDQPDSVYRSLNLSNTGVNANTTGAFLTGLILSNNGASAAHVKIYDKATAATSSDTPIMTVFVGAASTVAIGGMLVPCTNGISLRAVTEAADNGTTSPTANTVICDVLYRA